MKTLLIVLVVVAGATAQTPDTVRRSYGPPISETFIVRGGARATIEYARDGQVCRLTIVAGPGFTSREIASGPKDAQGDREEKLLTAALDDLVPPSRRGNLVASAFVNANSPKVEDSVLGSSVTYEAVSIFQGTHGVHKEVLVAWNNRTCQK